MQQAAPRRSRLLAKEAGFSGQKSRLLLARKAGFWPEEPAFGQKSRLLQARSRLTPAYAGFLSNRNRLTPAYAGFLLAKRRSRLLARRSRLTPAHAGSLGATEGSRLKPAEAGSFLGQKAGFWPEKSRLWPEKEPANAGFAGSSFPLGATEGSRRKPAKAGFFLARERAGLHRQKPAPFGQKPALSARSRLFWPKEARRA